MKKELLTDLVIKLFSVNAQCAQWGDDFTCSMGLTSSKWKMLGALGTKNEPVPISRIRYEMGLSRQGALKNINVLINTGFVKTADNKLHKKALLYSLTDQGWAAYEKLEIMWRSHLDAIEANFTESELEITLGTLRKFNNLHADKAYEENR